MSETKCCSHAICLTVTHQQYLKTQNAIWSKSDFLIGNVIETVDHMCEDSKRKKKRKEEEEVEEERCGAAGTSVYSQTGCFGTQSPLWQEYCIWQPWLCKLLSSQRKTATCTDSCTHWIVQSPPDCHLHPCINPAGLSLCAPRSSSPPSVIPSSSFRFFCFLTAKFPSSLS